MTHNDKIPALPGERWKDIKGYEDYAVSDFGRVWSKPRTVEVQQATRVSKNGKVSSGGKRVVELEGKMLTPEEVQGGYFRVTLWSKEGDKAKLRVHRIVAEAYVPNPDPENNDEVDHIDGDPKNNRAYNLRWVTHQENMDFARNRLGEFGSSNKPVPVRCVDTGELFESFAAAARWASGKEKVSSKTLRSTIDNGKAYYGHVFVLESEYASLENPEEYAQRLIAEYRNNTPCEDKGIMGKKKRNWKHCKQTNSKLTSLLGGQGSAAT